MDAQRKDNEALRNFFSSHTNVAEGTISYMVRTFKTMADMADFGGSADTEDDLNEEELDDSSTGDDRIVRRKFTKGNGMTVNINIQLQIPATDKAETYDNFFAAMKKHLLS